MDYENAPEKPRRGRRPNKDVPEEVRFAAKLSRDWVAQRLGYFLRMSKEQLDLVQKDENRESLDWWIAAILKRGIKNGDHNGLSFLLDRTIGKAADPEPTDPSKPIIIKTIDGRCIEMKLEQKNETPDSVKQPTEPLGNGDKGLPASL